MLLSGIHYNFSYAPEYPSFLGMETDALYLKAAVCTLRYAWLLVWLTAASPGPCRTETFGQCREGVRPVYASVRCGKEGYWNSFLPVLDFSGVSSYCDSIESYVKHDLYSAAQLENTTDKDATSDYYVFLYVMDGADTYYELTLSAKCFTAEDAERIARSIKIN